jgi:hypothetical protein
MAINFKMKPVEGFDPELLLIGEGYIARPVTLDQSSLAGITPDDKGNYYIPYGSYLYGSNGTSLLVDPNQLAKVVVPTEAKATVTLDSGLVLTAKTEGAVTTAVTMTVDATAHNDVFTYDAATGISIKLGTDKAGNVKDDFEKLAKKINEDLVLNSICVATVVAGKEADTPAADSGAFASGGATTVASDIDGILYHTVKVTDGEATGAMIIHGVINIDKMPSEPGAAIKAKLPHIQFARRD